MIRQLTAIVAFSCLASVAPFIEDIPAEYREFIPDHIREFLTGLSESEKAVIKDIAKNYSSYKNEDESLAALKKKSPELGAKAEKVHATTKEKLDALGDEAEAFVKEIIAGARKIHAQVIAGDKPTPAELKEKVQSAINKYDALSNTAKEELQEQCPHIASIFKSEKFNKLAVTLIAGN